MDREKGGRAKSGRDREVSGGKEGEWRPAWCYQNVRFLGLKLYHYQLTLKLLYWSLVNYDFIDR